MDIHLIIALFDDQWQYSNSYKVQIPTFRASHKALMSSRALRRLQADDLEKTLAKYAPSAQDDESETVSRSNNSARPANVFALMGDQDDDESSEDQSHSEPEAEKKPPVKVVQLPTKSQKKKNKSKKNKKSKQAPRVQSSENADDSDEDLDNIIRQFQKRDLEKKGKPSTLDVNSEDSDYDTAYEEEEGIHNRGPADLKNDSGFAKFTAFPELSRIFGNIDMKNLNPDHEYKLLFGDLSPESLADVDSMASTHVSPQVMKQIEKLKHMVRNWGGKDHKTVPNGSTTRRLAFTKIRDDWIPTPRGEFALTPVTPTEVLDWQCWQRPDDWEDEIKRTTSKWQNAGIKFYKFEPSNTESNRKAITEFYMSVVLHPDHEALISLISSKFPYHVPALLQVALILVRQGDKANSNGLVERALFVFDRALRSHVSFDGQCQMPYIFFFNRQFYFAIFRYIQILAQRGAISTASEWCKTLWSLSPLEDPLGCRYFIDHYLILNKEYTFLVKLASSPLVNTYVQWYTLGLSLGFVLSYLKLGMTAEAKAELKKAFSHHPGAISAIFKDMLLGDPGLLEELSLPEETPDVALETKAYFIRMKAIWGGVELKFLHDAIQDIASEYKANKISLCVSKTANAGNVLFLENIPINLLRFAVLSQESPLMACIPQEVWSDRDVYEFDVLPPLAHDRESEDLVESVKSFIDESELSMTRMEMMQDESLLNQIRQLSLEQFLDENPNAVMDD